MPDWVWGSAIMLVLGRALGRALGIKVPHRRSAIVHLIVRLRRAERYAPALDALLLDSDFTTPEGRAQALCHLTRLIHAEDIADAVVMRGKPSLFAERRAVQLWRHQMQRGAIKQGLDKALPALPRGVPRVREGDECVLGLVVTGEGLRGVLPGGVREAENLLFGLRITQPPPGAVYLYYLPDPGEPLDPAAAWRIFETLGASARAAMPSPE